MKRDHYWDSLKFILMFLVVCFHTIEYYAPDGSWNRAFYTVSSLFHMHNCLSLSQVDFLTLTIEGGI